MLNTSETIAREPQVTNLRLPAEPAHASRHTASMLNLLQSLESALAKVEGGKIVLFASARPGEGKTTVVGELAAVLRESTRHRVAVIDAGPRHDLSNRYGPPAPAELHQLVGSLRSSARGKSAQHPGARSVFVRADEGTGEQETPFDERDTWSCLKAAFDYILLEMPSVADSRLALTYARHVDAVVLVIESGRTRWQIVQNAQDQLRRAGAPIAGAFLNKRVYYIPQVLYNWL